MILKSRSEMLTRFSNGLPYFGRQRNLFRIVPFSSQAHAPIRNNSSHDLHGITGESIPLTVTPNQCLQSFAEEKGEPNKFLFDSGHDNVSSFRVNS